MLKSVAQSNKRPMALAALTGACLGALISFLVAAVLLEISDNRFFAVYFGILFLIVGLSIAKRVTVSSVWMEGGRLSRTLLAMFALTVLMASIACFILDHNTLKLSAPHRIPFYIFLGIAVSFAVTFALVDVLNAMIATVHSSKQVFLVLGASVFSGFLYGLVFGILDVEDDPSARHGLIRDERFCAPMGALIGAITGAIAYRMHGGEYLAAVPYTPRTFDDGL